MTFEELKFTSKYGKRAVVTFPNGYGASVISDGYGSEHGRFEIAVLGPDGGLDYSTPVTDDVIGWLTEQGVSHTLKQIANLPTQKETIS